MEIKRWEGGDLTLGTSIQDETAIRWGGRANAPLQGSAETQARLISVVCWLIEEAWQFSYIRYVSRIRVHP